MSDPYRHPGGRTCRKALPAVIVLLPYIAFMAARDGIRDARRARKIK